MKKEPLMCYFHFMFNQWNETTCKIVFAKSCCGWQHLWNKWLTYIDNYGYYGAISMYYVEALDRELQAALSTYANEYYNGKE